MAKPKRERPTDNAFGLKINLVLSEMGMPGDYAALAKAFGVRVPSVYGWIDNGRIHKNKLSQLAEWSGRPLEWWLDSSTSPAQTDLPSFARQALSRLEVIGQKLSKKDWALLVATATHLAQEGLSDATQSNSSSGIVEKVLEQRLSTETTDIITHQK